MSVHLITGYAGEEHILAEDHGSFNASFFGTGQFVMEAGNQCSASIIDNNTVRVFDGDILMKGRHIRINPNTYEDCIIETGTADTNRYDLICMQYSKDLSTTIESSSLVVIRGEEVTGTPSDPSYTDGDILGGDSFNQMPLYRVKISGVVLSEIECLFEVIPTYATLAKQYAEQFKKDCQTHLDSLGILDTMEEVEANTQANQLVGALALKEGMAESYKLLYTNPSATSTIAAQTLLTSADHYDYLDVEFVYHVSNLAYRKTMRVAKNSTLFAQFFSFTSTNHITVATRNFTFGYDGISYKLAIGDAVTQTEGYAQNVNNEFCVPYRIYGGKIFN